MSLVLKKTNEYGQKKYLQQRPNERFKTNKMKQFIGLCLLFSLDSLYYYQIFLATMSGKRLEQIIRILNCSSEDKNDDIGKVNTILNR